MASPWLPVMSQQGPDRARHLVRESHRDDIGRTALGQLASPFRRRLHVGECRAGAMDEQGAEIGIPALDRRRHRRNVPARRPRRRSPPRTRRPNRVASGRAHTALQPPSRLRARSGLLVKAALARIPRLRRPHEASPGTCCRGTALGRRDPHTSIVLSPWRCRTRALVYDLPHRRGFRAPTPHSALGSWRIERCAASSKLMRPVRFCWGNPRPLRGGAHAAAAAEAAEHDIFCAAHLEGERARSAIACEHRDMPWDSALCHPREPRELGQDTRRH